MSATPRTWNWKRHERAEREGITGTPAFILAEWYLVSGSQPYGAPESAVRRVAGEMDEPDPGED